MNKKDFNKGIKGLQSIRMTDVEKARILKNVFSAPTESPYLKRYPLFAYVFAGHARVTLASFLILMLSLGGAVYGSEESLPGDLLYPIKIKVVEPVLDVVNRAPEKKIVWEEAKITRRVIEAEKLADKNELNDDIADRLEREIKKSSAAFIEAVNEMTSSVATSTSSAFDKANDFKQEFRRKIHERGKMTNESKSAAETRKDADQDLKRENDREEKKGSGKGEWNELQAERIERLKNSAIKIIDDENRDKDRDDDEDIEERSGNSGKSDGDQDGDDDDNDKDSNSENSGRGDGD